MENDTQTANLVAESQRIIARHEAGEFVHEATLAMARAALVGVA